MREVHIVGGGLAGLSLGIGLRANGVPVRITERGSYPQHKVCGEFISGVSDEMLDQLHIRHILDSAQILDKMAWWIDGERVINEQLPSTARGISRYLLDDRLAQYFVELGGVLETRRAWRDLGEEGVVFATGKRKGRGKRWIGLKAHYRGYLAEGLEMHSSLAGYAGVAAIEDEKVNVCALFELDRSLKGERLLETYMRHGGLNYLADRLETCECDTASVSAIAGFEFGGQSDEGVFAVGDAQYLIPPFTGNGMSMALESSALALPFIQGYSEGVSSWGDALVSYQATKSNYFKKRSRLASGLHPLFFHPMSQSLLSQLGKRVLFPTSFLFKQLRTP